MTGYRRDVLVDVLVHHWPTRTNGCECGWAVLGASFPEHVADVYEDAQRGHPIGRHGGPSFPGGETG